YITEHDVGELVGLPVAVYRVEDQASAFAVNAVAVDDVVVNRRLKLHNRCDPHHFLPTLVPMLCVGTFFGRSAAIRLHWPGRLGTRPSAFALDAQGRGAAENPYRRRASARG